jgi:hypothetical protein
VLKNKVVWVLDVGDDTAALLGVAEVGEACRDDRGS